MLALGFDFSPINALETLALKGVKWLRGVKSLMASDRRLLTVLALAHVNGLSHVPTLIHADNELAIANRIGKGFAESVSLTRVLIHITRMVSGYLFLVNTIFDFRIENDSQTSNFIKRLSTTTLSLGNLVSHGKSVMLRLASLGFVAPDFKASVQDSVRITARSLVLSVNNLVLLFTRLSLPLFRRLVLRGADFSLVSLASETFLFCGLLAHSLKRLSGLSYLVNSIV